MRPSPNPPRATFSEPSRLDLVWPAGAPLRSEPPHQFPRLSRGLWRVHTPGCHCLRCSRHSPGIPFVVLPRGSRTGRVVRSFAGSGFMLGLLLCGLLPARLGFRFSSSDLLSMCLVRVSNCFFQEGGVLHRGMFGSCEWPVLDGPSLVYERRSQGFSFTL